MGSSACCGTSPNQFENNIENQYHDLISNNIKNKIIPNNNKVITIEEKIQQIINNYNTTNNISNSGNTMNVYFNVKMTINKIDGLIVQKEKKKQKLIQKSNTNINQVRDDKNEKIINELKEEIKRLQRDKEIL